MKSKDEILTEFIEKPDCQNPLLIELIIDLRNLLDKNNDILIMQNAKLEQISRAIWALGNKK